MDDPVDSAAMDLLTSAGINQVITQTNKAEIVQLVIKHFLVYRVAACIDQFREGTVCAAYSKSTDVHLWSHFLSVNIIFQ